MPTDSAKARILDVAGPAFAEKGYAGTSVREICEAAQVNLAAINYYFGSKESLYVEAFRLAHPMSKDAAKSFEWAEGTSPAEKLRAFIHLAMQSLVGLDRDSWQGRLLIREMLDPTPACLEQFKELITHRHEALKQIVRELLPEETAEDLIYKTAFSVMGQCLHYRLGEKIMTLLVPPPLWEAEFSTDRIADHIANVCLAALGLEPPIGQERTEPARSPAQPAPLSEQPTSDTRIATQRS